MDITKKSGNRIAAIDRVRGVCMFYIIFGHGLMYWLLPQEQYIVGFGAIFSEVAGADMFLFISGMSMVLSYNANMRKVQNDPRFTIWHARLQIWIRTAWIIGISFVFNFLGMAATGLIVLGPMVMWNYFVLQTLWIGRTVSYPTLRSSPWTRVVIGLAFFLLADGIRDWVLQNNSPLFLVLFADPTLNPPFPYLGFFFIGSAVGTWIDQLVQQERSIRRQTIGAIARSSSELSRFLSVKYLALAGGVLLCVSFLIGGKPQYFQILTQGVTWRINLLPDWQLYSLLALFTKSSTAWAFYALGCEFLIFAAFFHYDLKQMKHPSNGANILSFSSPEQKTYRNSTKAATLFGQQSLTVFLIQFMLFFIFSGMLTIWQYLVVAPIAVVILHTGIWIWANGKGKGYTLDWFVGYSTNKLVENILKKKKHLVHTVTLGR